jgi:hypothetical protein
MAHEPARDNRNKRDQAPILTGEWNQYAFGP